MEEEEFVDSLVRIGTMNRVGKGASRYRLREKGKIGVFMATSGN